MTGALVVFFVRLRVIGYLSKPLSDHALDGAQTLRTLPRVVLEYVSMTLTSAPAGLGHPIVPPAGWGSAAVFVPAIVLAVLAHDGVAAARAAEIVVADAAEERVVPVIAEDFVVVAVTLEQVVSVLAEHAIVVRPAEHDVVAQIRAAWRIVYACEPQPDELSAAAQFVLDQATHFAAHPMDEAPRPSSAPSGPSGELYS